MKRGDAQYRRRSEQPASGTPPFGAMIGKIMRGLPPPFGSHICHVGAGRVVDNHPRHIAGGIAQRPGAAAPIPVFRDANPGKGAGLRLAHQSYIGVAGGNVG